MRLERIVVGVDFREPSVAAIRWTARRFAPSAELVLSYAVDLPQSSPIGRGDHPAGDPLVENATRGAEDRLRELVTEIRALDRTGSASYEVRVGAPAERLLRCARDHGADLVVVGPHVERGGPRDWLGSTAEHVLRASEVPVLLVAGARDAEPRRILVALDEDELTTAVLRTTAELRARFDGEVLALHVLRSVPVLSELAMAQLGGGGMAFDPGLVDRELDRESQRWHASVRSAGLPAGHARTEVAIGDPGHELVAAAQRDASDLIVIGNRRGPPGRTLLGSVVRHVLRHAPCPVLALTPVLDEIADDEARTLRTVAP